MSEFASFLRLYIGRGYMKHPTENLLSAYLSGDLCEEERQDFERHLFACSSCQQEIAFLIQTIAEDPSDAEIAILDRIDSTAPVRRKAESQSSLYVLCRQWALMNRKLLLVSIGLVLFALVGVGWTLLPRNNVNRATQTASLERSLEGRFSWQIYSPFTHTRTGPIMRNQRDGQDRLDRLSSSPLERGRFYLEHNDLMRAVGELESAEQADPRSPEIHNDLGVAYLETGTDESRTKAIDEFQRALQLRPQFAPALFNLGLAYERSGRFAEAEQELRRYLKIDADSEWAEEVKAKLQLGNR